MALKSLSFGTSVVGAAFTVEGLGAVAEGLGEFVIADKADVVEGRNVRVKLLRFLSD
jgi:hypothetical protein